MLLGNDTDVKPAPRSALPAKCWKCRSAPSWSAAWLTRWQPLDGGGAIKTKQTSRSSAAPRACWTARASTNR